jgi:hypothetical protein
VPGALRSAALQLRTVRHVFPRGSGSLRRRFGPLDDRIVFVIGSPRSGTTFIGRALGSLPRFVELGEVAPLKAAIPELAQLAPDQAAPRLRRVVVLAGRLGLAGGLRGVEHTPENAFVAEALAAAFPQARFVHPVRDGRDVATSLLERGWLSAERAGADDAGAPFGPSARFWVEPDRRDEFAAASDARRAAWAWRRYVEAARAVPERTIELRYERLVERPAETARALAEFLGVEPTPLDRALAAAHSAGVGRHRRDLSAAQLADIEEEAGGLLHELGYLQSV